MRLLWCSLILNAILLGLFVVLQYTNESLIMDICISARSIKEIKDKLGMPIDESMEGDMRTLKYKRNSCMWNLYVDEDGRVFNVKCEQ